MNPLTFCFRIAGIVAVKQTKLAVDVILLDIVEHFVNIKIGKITTEYVVNKYRNPALLTIQRKYQPLQQHLGKRLES
jgi:hypothetical protein